MLNINIHEEAAYISPALVKHIREQIKEWREFAETSLCSTEAQKADAYARAHELENLLTYCGEKAW